MGPPRTTSRPRRLTPADAASVSEPRNARAVSGTVRHDVAADQADPSGDFAVRHDRIFDVGKLGVDDVQVRPANSAGADLHPNLAFAGDRIFPLLHLKRSPAGYVGPIGYGAPVLLVALSLVRSDERHLSGAR